MYGGSGNSSGSSSKIRKPKTLVCKMLSTTHSLFLLLHFSLIVTPAVTTTSTTTATTIMTPTSTATTTRATTTTTTSAGSIASSSCKTRALLLLHGSLTNYNNPCFFQHSTLVRNNRIPYNSPFPQYYWIKPTKEEIASGTKNTVTATETKGTISSMSSTCLASSTGVHRNDFAIAGVVDSNKGKSLVGTNWNIPSFYSNNRSNNIHDKSNFPVTGLVTLWHQCHLFKTILLDSVESIVHLLWEKTAAQIALALTLQQQQLDEVRTVRQITKLFQEYIVATNTNDIRSISSSLILAYDSSVPPDSSVTTTIGTSVLEHPLQKSKLRLLETTNKNFNNNNNRTNEDHDDNQDKQAIETDEITVRQNSSNRKNLQQQQSKRNFVMEKGTVDEQTDDKSFVVSRALNQTEVDGTRSRAEIAKEIMTLAQEQSKRNVVIKKKTKADKLAQFKEDHDDGTLDAEKRSLRKEQLLEQQRLLELAKSQLADEMSIKKSSKTAKKSTKKKDAKQAKKEKSKITAKTSARGGKIKVSLSTPNSNKVGQQRKVKGVPLKKPTIQKSVATSTSVITPLTPDENRQAEEARLAIISTSSLSSSLMSPSSSSSTTSRGTMPRNVLNISVPQVSVSTIEDTQDFDELERLAQAARDAVDDFERRHQQEQKQQKQVKLPQAVLKPINSGRQSPDNWSEWTIPQLKAEYLVRQQAFFGNKAPSNTLKISKAAKKADIIAMLRQQDIEMSSPENHDNGTTGTLIDRNNLESNGSLHLEVKEDFFLDTIIDDEMARAARAAVDMFGKTDSVHVPGDSVSTEKEEDFEQSLSTSFWQDDLGLSDEWVQKLDALAQSVYKPVDQYKRKSTTVSSKAASTNPSTTINNASVKINRMGSTAFITRNSKKTEQNTLTIASQHKQHQQNGPIDYASLTVPLLKAELKSRKLPVSGRKAELIARLVAHDFEAVATESESLKQQKDQVSMSQGRNIIYDGIFGITEQYKQDLYNNKKIDVDDSEVSAREMEALDALLAGVENDEDTLLMGMMGIDEPSDEALREIEKEMNEFNDNSNEDNNNGFMIPLENTNIGTTSTTVTEEGYPDLSPTTSQNNLPPLVDYNKMAVSLLKMELKRRGLRTNGKKTELVSRLQAFDAVGSYYYNVAPS